MGFFKGYRLDQYSSAPAERHIPISLEFQQSFPQGCFADTQLPAPSFLRINGADPETVEQYGILDPVIGNILVRKFSCSLFFCSIMGPFLSSLSILL